MLAYDPGLRIAAYSVDAFGIVFLGSLTVTLSADVSGFMAAMESVQAAIAGRPL